MSVQGWTVKEAAKALGRSEKTIRRNIKSGKMKAEQVPGKYGMEYRIVDLPVGRPLDRGPDISIDNALVKALDMVRALQAESERLAGQVGFLQAQLQEAQNKIRLLSAPKLPWWRRLLWRKRS
jgi:excisionase family DNA binding protein